MKVIGYIRGSTEEQQNTLAAQETQIRAYAGFKQFELVDCIIDSGESAFSVDFLERPKVAELLHRMKETGATHIIVTKLDRGFRGAVDLLLTMDVLKGQGIGLHLLDIGLDPTTAVGEMVATIIASVARYECRRRSERQKEAFSVMREEGKRCGTIPYGWDAVTSLRTSKTGRQADDLIPNPEEQAVLRRMTGEWSGLTDCEIARRLNRESIPAKKGGKWYAASAKKVRLNARIAEEAAAAA